MDTKRIGALVMAAGNASRFGENKLAARLDGKTLIERTLDALPEGLFWKTIVVTQYEEVAQMACARDLICRFNAHPDWGISHTISLGTNELLESDAILYLVSDQPLLQGASISRVVQTWLENPEKIVGAAHEGRRGNPCIFPRRFYPELLALEGDRGGNFVIREHPECLLTVEIPELELTDVDTPKALQDLADARD